MPETVSADRIEAVCAAAERWREQLVDTSGRNRLRNYRDLKTGTLDLTPDSGNGLDALMLDQLLAGRTVSLGALFPTLPDDTDAFDDARRRLSTIHRKARENLEEKGIATLFAAVGLATWRVETGTTPHAPVILLPLEVEATGAAARDFSIAVSGDAHLNPVLAHILRAEHDIATDAAEEEVAEAPPESLAGFRALLDRLAEAWDALPELAIEPRAVAAVFSYATMPLVSDLAENGEEFARNDLVAAIAGDGDAREALTGGICDPAPNQPDTDAPADEFLVLDADSSQHMAINRVLGGESLVIQGPPGTGKSQTIANLITALIARGGRVLFVAEKRAAIEAVTKRLDAAGLADLVMDMHGGVTSRREFARTLADSLEHVATVPDLDYSKMHRGLRSRRDALLEHANTVHDQREPWGLSLYEMEARLLAVPEAARTRLRLPTDAARSLDRDGFERLRGEIGEWVDLGGPTFAADHPEWSRSDITTRDAASEAFDLARDLDGTYYPDARDALFTALDEVGLARPETVAEWQEMLGFLTNVEQMLARCSPVVYRLDRADVRQALTPRPGTVAAQAIHHLSDQSSAREREAFDLAIRLADDLLPRAHTALDAMLEEVGGSLPGTLAEWTETVEFLSAIEQALTQWHPEAYRLDLATLREAIAPRSDTVAAGAIRHLSEKPHAEEREGFGMAIRLADEILPAARKALETTLNEVGGSLPDTLADWREAVEFLLDLEWAVTQWHPDAYGLDHAALREAIAPGNGLPDRVTAQLYAKGAEQEREGYALLARLADELPVAHEALCTALDEVGLRQPRTITAWMDTIGLLRDVQKMLVNCPNDIYGKPPTERKKMLPPEASGFADFLKSLFSAGHRAEKAAREDTLREIASQAGRWSDWSTDGLPPRLPANLRELLDRTFTVADTLERIQRLITTGALAQVEYDALLAVLSRMGEHWSAREALRATLREPADLSAPDALALLDAIEGYTAEWARRGGTGEPRVPRSLADANERLTTLMDEIAALSRMAAVPSLDRRHDGALAETLDLLKGHWNARETLRAALRDPADLSASDALALLDKIEGQAAEWARRGGTGEPRVPRSLADASERLTALMDELATFTRMASVPSFSRVEHDTVLSETLEMLKEHWAVREAVTAVLRAPAHLSATDALNLVREAGKQIEKWTWRSVDGGEPRLPDGLASVRERVGALARALDDLGAIIGDYELRAREADDLATLLERLAANRTVVANIPRIRELEAGFREAKIAGVLERVGADIPPEHAADAVEHAWLSRVLDDLEFDDRRLSAFDADAHSHRRDEFIALDRQHRDSTPQRILRLVAEATVAAMNEHPEQTLLVRKEAAKKRRHLSVRQLFARAPHVLSALRPCWTMSPVLATEMIPAQLDLFDVVVFDEASQIPPAEAIGSLARAPQAVIAGDSRQLPPTSFFGHDPAGDEEDDDDTLALTSDIESLLDAAGALLSDKMLEWHYRSRDDRLIAFSNNHIYGGGLTAFPGSLKDPPIEHRLVPYRPLTGGSSAPSHPDEAEEVVNLVIAHARERPHETLGVIAFGLRHAGNIENVLLRRLGELNDRSLDAFFAETNAERFFVKSIERVQGDERDAIILSVGYFRRSADGSLVHNFGPINHEGGERRLNVAVTRARSRLTLVSSFGHHDMEPGRSEAKGVELLRKYLEFAASGGTDLGADVVDVPLNPFELSIRDGLERRGIPVTSQYGVSGYRIDFACAHPDQPGRMVLAIEADGASYHSTPTARDRDRLRQQVLEDKGWRFHRIWSTAWFRDREAELDKAERAWRDAVAKADAGPPPNAPPSEAVAPPAAPPPERSGPRPNVPRVKTPGYNDVTDYHDHQLEDLARWIDSDGLLRTDEQLMAEMQRELGFRRRGKRIEDALARAIRRARP